MAQWLAGRIARGEVAVIRLDRPGPALLDHLRGRRHVVLIDAARLPPGSPPIVELPWRDLARHAAPHSSHALGVAETLALGEALGLLPERLTVWAVDLRQGEAAVRRVAP